MFRNSEHYPDPTAGQALKNIREDEKREALERIKPMMKVMHELANAFGFEIAERIVLIDKRTGRVYK